MQNFRPLRPREIIGFTFSIYRARFGTLLGISLALVGIPSLLQWVPGVGWLMTLLVALSEIVATAAFIRITAAHCVDLSVSAGDSIRAAWSRFRRLLGAWLVTALGVLMVATVMIVIGTAILAVVSPGMLEDIGKYADDPLGFDPGVLIPFLAWTLVMLLPAIGLAVLWWAAPMAVMVEGTAAFDGLRRSWRLVMARFGRTVGVLLLAVVVIAPPAMVIYWLLPAYLAAVLAGVWIVPFFSVLGTVLYLDLRARSEGLTSEVLTEELTST